MIKLKCIKKIPILKPWFYMIPQSCVAAGFGGPNIRETSSFISVFSYKKKKILLIPNTNLNSSTNIIEQWHQVACTFCICRPVW